MANRSRSTQAGEVKGASSLARGTPKDYGRISKGPSPSESLTDYRPINHPSDDELSSAAAFVAAKRYCWLHSCIDSRMGMKVLPIPLSRYSTRGGISGNISRSTNPSRSSSRNCLVRVDWVISPREGANKRGNSSRLTQSFHFFLFEPFFLP